MREIVQALAIVEEAPFGPMRHEELRQQHGRQRPDADGQQHERGVVTELDADLEEGDPGDDDERP